ncbi:MAG: rhodanese-like domain-containing protein [Bacteroidota bacterium]
MRFLSLLFVLFLFGCGSSAESQPATPPPLAYQDLSVEEFAEKIGGDNTVLLDVRTPQETAGGVIEGAIELDFRSPDFSAQLKALNPDKTYLVYCASGGRSGKTAEMLHDLGVQQVYNLKGGYRAWSR